MNFVAIEKFFYIICKVILLYLFANKHYNRNLSEIISICFKKIETNNYNMRYFYYLVWLKRALYLPTLYSKIPKNIDFCIRLLAFLKYIIKYFVKNYAFSDTLYYFCLNMHKVNTIENFIN